MPTIRLTVAAHQALLSQSTNGFAPEAAVLQLDGTFLIQIDQEVHDSLASRCYPGESYSDTILRLAAFATQTGNQ